MGVKIGGEEISFLGDLDLNKMNTARDIWQIKYLSDVSIYITVRASFTDLNDKYSDFWVFVLKNEITTVQTLSVGVLVS